MWTWFSTEKGTEHANRAGDDSFYPLSAQLKICLSSSARYLESEGNIITRTVYLYVFDTLADWEPAFALAELRSGRYFKDQTLTYDVKTVGLTKNPVTTMGGIRILPDLTVAEINAEGAGLLILPGGNTWLDPIHAPIYPVVRSFLDRRIPVAAICGATFGLAANGLLDERSHTSNDLGYLKMCAPAYRGEARYVHKPAVCDRDLITASGIAPLEFAREIFTKLDVMAPATIESWYQLYRTHEPAHFFALMQSLPKA
jgi:putative intracellular protease/amidase